MIRILSALLFLTVIHTALFAQCPQLVWSDEFDGTGLDLAKWEQQIGDGCNINLCNWGNNELEYYQAANTTVSGGTLKITAKKESAGGKSYTSSRIRTKNKADFIYGRFEARMKLPTGQGIWPAFWMLSTNEPYGGWPQSGEIDIMELVGNEPNVAHGTIHFGNLWPNNSSSGGSYELRNGSFNDDFHEFALEWEQNEIRWYIDGYLYSRKTRADVSPHRWPFDKSFHILLNLAVGGNWPGSPNSSTVFPQVMEVDYVRVYDMSRPTISGNETVGNKAVGEIYTVHNAAAGATYNWSIPEGATIVSGQGTSRITVDWGDTDSGGDVSVEVVSSCETIQLKLEVVVEEGFEYDFSFENFDDPSKLTYFFSTGVLNEVTNPAPEGLNTSALSGKYSRNIGEQYDILIYTTEAIPDASEYLNGKRKFYIDVYTSAPVGTLILLQLEDNLRATSSNYPIGRHSRFQAFTSVRNQWERLEFSFLDRPHTGTSDTRVNQLILLFASNTRTGDTYYWDNLDSYAKKEGQTTLVIAPMVLADFPFEFYPNPVQEELYIEPKKDSKLNGIRILDQQGRNLRLMEREGVTGLQKIDVKNLSQGLYYLQVEADDRKVYTVKFVKE